MSVVPTVYSVGSSQSSSSTPKPGSGTIMTNQYAVTEKDNEVDERTIPGLFFKYDIEPILLTIEERRDSFLTFLIKLINVVSGVLVAGHWGFTLTEWAREVLGRRRRGGRRSEGVIGAKNDGYED